MITKQKEKTAKYKLIPVESSGFCDRAARDYSKLPFYEEVKAAFDNPSMAVEVEWPYRTKLGTIQTAIERVKRAFPGHLIKVSFREELREKGVFHIMYGGKRAPKPKEIDVGEPEHEYRIASPRDNR